MSDGFTCLRIPTPFAIGAVNVYLIHGDSPTLIDTGPDWPPARQALTAALAEEGLSPRDIARVLVTHGHSDHSGLTGWLQSQGAEIFMHPDEAAKLSGINLFILRDAFLRQMGTPPDALESFADVGENNFNATIREFKPVTANQHIDVGHYSLFALPVPGHCGGHMAFYQKEQQLLFGGDALLKDVSPNPLPELHMGLPEGRTRSLYTYFTTLRRLEELPLSVVMPGHGEPVLEPAQRIVNVRNLHRDRLGKVLAMVGRGITPYNLASQLYGPLSGWDVYLAVAEACAHLDWLADGGWLKETRGEPGSSLFFIPTGKPWSDSFSPVSL